MQWRLPAQIKSSGMVNLDQRDWGCVLSFSLKKPILATFSDEKKTTTSSILFDYTSQK